MKTVKLFTILILLINTITANAQVEKIETEYLSKLAESFKSADIKQYGGKLFWSKCLGENTALPDNELNKRIAALTTDNTARIAFYKRVNYYMSSTIGYYHQILKLRKVVPLTPAINKEMKKGRGDYSSASSNKVAAPVFAAEDLKSFFDYMLKFGEDLALSTICVPEGTIPEQIKTEDEPKVFAFVEEPAQFAGGDAGLIKFLQMQITYPQHERDNDIQGKVMLRFVVCTDGRVSNVKVMRSVSEGLDTEAMRVVKMLPPFKPGYQQGKPVLVYFSLPVVFKLQ